MTDEAPDPPYTGPSRPYNGFRRHFVRAATAYGDRHPELRPRHVPASFKGCACCGQDKGQQWWHNEDYRMPLDSFVVCPWCHWTLHKRFRLPDVFAAWVDRVHDGWMPPPAPRGVKVADWRTLFATVPPDQWPGEHTMLPITDSLLDLLGRRYTGHLPDHLRVADGAPHHRRQWRTDPPLKFFHLRDA